MWRNRSIHPLGETEFLDAALERVQGDLSLRRRADAVLSGVAAQEPLFAEALKAPQSPHYHAEGPSVGDHLRDMLIALHAVADESLHLLDIEEFRRLKGYEGEIEELEEILKERFSFFLAFTLAHDAGKWASVAFESPPGTKGAELGFRSDPMMAWHELGAIERAKLRAQYLDLYRRFAENHPNEVSARVQEKFFLAYGIRVRYPGHDRIVHTPVYRGLLARLAEAHRVRPEHVTLLEDVIAHHLDPLGDFADGPAPERMRRFYAIARDRGYDADDFIDVLQGCLYLDAVCGSARLAPHGAWHDPSPLVNFLRSEHEYAPGRRAEKSAAREEEEKHRRNRLFRETGLDGVALMDLFKMEPGPRFGALLTRVHEAVSGRGELPAMPEATESELQDRMARYYEKAFDKDI